MITLTNCIGLLLQADVVSKSQLMAEKDPHGWIMSLTSVSVVFLSLIILFICYKYIGVLMSGDFKLPKCRCLKKKKTGAKEGMTPEIAAAIAMALEAEQGKEAEAAIAMALHCYLNDTVHDNESYVLTMKPTFSNWADRQSTVRQLPTR